MKDHHSLLDTAKSYLLEEVAPLANEIDCNPTALFQALRGFGELGMLALLVPRQWGGQEVSEQTYGSFQELVARYSGALAFLQTQHQSAAGMLVASSNSSLQEKYLPRMSNGEVLLGVGFSQLRREGDPLTVAIPVPGGYQLNGVVPWVTGQGFFSEFIVAATLPDSGAVFGVVPLRETHQESGGAMTLSTPAQLAAMTSTNTVTVTLKNWFLAAETVVFIKPAGWIHENDKKNVLRATFLATGCALAGLDILESVARTKSLSFITNAFDSLQQELKNCRTAVQEAQNNSGLELSERLELRAWAIDLAARIAHAAVTVSSGAALHSSHDAQRVYREALVFTVTGQTRAVMEATLLRLISRNLTPNPSPPAERGVNLPLACGGIEGGLISYSRVIHLSHVIDLDIPQWQGDPPVDFETVAELHKDGYYLRRFSMGEHSATHINAPNSFHLNGVGIDEYSAQSLVVPAVVIDIREKVVANSDYALCVDDILAWEQQYGEIPPGCVLLVYTGWQEKWLDKNAFFNQDAQGKMHFPGFSRDATRFLLEERQIAGVGIDTHGVDSGQDTTFGTNRLVLQKPRIVLENLTNLDQLPPTGATLVIGVLRLQGGSGSPVGVLAFLP
ncbi:cyclase family protein [Scytonema sp. HK-05]|uniref:cyclase family protein n=1 Tax=Scytonema sp. HK-05 TaxID=1137095 RepID=UPI0009366F56|nr:cyclase family protein [Scytonema sp. HK-05]OKH44275.1 cyclase [Scytonema sp. HK-05]BAY48602.1 cyclase family protein [Scytonema sp. HK-05]